MLRAAIMAAVATALATSSMSAPAAFAQPVVGPEARWVVAPSGETTLTARHESSTAVVGNKLYLIGGRDFDGRPRPLEILDLDSGKWTRGASPPVSFHHAQAAVFGGRIYIAGAITRNMPGEENVPNVLIYDPAGDRWTTGPEIPADRRRGGAGFVFHDGLFYLVGGNTLGHRAGYVPWMDSFDPRTGAWRKLPDAPRPRDHAHAAVLNGKIYMAGGRRSSLDTGQSRSLTIAEVDIYDIESRRWTTATAPIPTQRAGVGVVAIAGRVVVIGGETEHQLPAHSEVEAYNPATGRWETLPPLQTGRHGAQAVVVGDTIQVVAGSAGRPNLGERNDREVLSLAFRRGR